LKIFYADQFAIPLPAKHTFPAQKYVLLRKRLLASNRVARENFHVSPAATLEEITRVRIFMCRPLRPWKKSQGFTVRTIFGAC
jgi:hypothetical protein